ncbi:MAG: hypothetical protein ABII90_07405 [Bacteroidota bacterium]
MKKIVLYLTTGLIAANAFIININSANAQKTEEYYYKLGKKYVMQKDFEQATNHFYKCVDIAEENSSTNPNYYYYPALMFYYGHGKEKQVLKAMDLITPLILVAPGDPKKPDDKTEKDFEQFFEQDKIKFDKSDYLFLRYYIQFKTGEIDITDAFNRLEYTVMYHNPQKSKIPVSDIYKLMVDIYTGYFKESADVEQYYRQYQEQVCEIFKKAAQAGNNEALKVVKEECK